MAKYLFTYHGGSDGDMPTDEAAIAEVMAAWGAWFGQLGEAVIDPGNPVGQSTTVLANKSVEQNGGANPVTGYGMFEAESQQAAEEMAKGCPVLNYPDGTVEVTEIIELPDPS